MKMLSRCLPAVGISVSIVALIVALYLIVQKLRCGSLEGMGQLLTVILLAVGGLFGVSQFHERDLERERANLVAIMARAADHNWHIIDSKHRREVVEQTLSLSIKDRSPLEKEKYWAARAVHLSHLNILYQVWELADRSKNLGPKDEGWARFASRIAKNLQDCRKPFEGEPSEWAGYDLWRSRKEGAFPESFIDWLREMASKHFQ